MLLAQWLAIRYRLLNFSKYINGLECKIGDKSVMSKFANDSKLVPPLDTCIDEMQKDIEHSQNWAEDWQILYIADKCGVMHFGYHNTCLTNLRNINHKEAKGEKNSGVMVHKSLKVSQQCAASTREGTKLWE